MCGFSLRTPKCLNLSFSPVYSNENYLLDLLVEAGAIDSGSLDAIRDQLSPMDSVVEYLVNNGYMTADYIAQVAAMNSGMSGKVILDWTTKKEE